MGLTASVRKTPLFKVARSAAITVFREYYRLQSHRPPRILVYHAWPDFERKANALAEVLSSHGLPVEQRSGYSSRLFAEMRSSQHLWVGFWNEFPFEHLPKHYVFYNAEPLTVARWGEDEEWTNAMRGAVAVWDYSHSNDAVHASRGIAHTHVPFGYSPYYERMFRESIGGSAVEQDIDILFVGSASERRMHMLDQLRKRGMVVHTVTRENPAHGARLDELLARTRILLDIHYHEESLAQVADFARLDQLLANRVFVIQERPRAEAPEAFGDFVTTALYEEMPDMCARFLADPEERTRRADRAHDWFMREMHFDRFIPYEQLERDLRGGA